MTDDFTPEEIANFTAFEKEGWSRVADAYHNQWGTVSAQSTPALLRMAGVQSGHRVLDVATGAGYLAAAAHDAGASATGLDFSAEQVALARSVYPDVVFIQGDAEDLPFESEGFDAVVMGFGMNHLPRPERAATEACRVLKPGGRLSFSVWAIPQPGTAFDIVLGAIEAEGIADPDLPTAPPYFKFADAMQVQTLLADAGFDEISTVVVDQHWRHSTPDQLFSVFHDGAVRASAFLRSQPVSALDNIRRRITNEVSGMKRGDQYVIPAPAAVSAGRKPPVGG